MLSLCVITILCGCECVYSVELQLVKLESSVHWLNAMLQSTLSVKIAARYNNQKLGAWEPLIEPWEVDAELFVPSPSHSQDDSLGKSRLQQGRVMSIRSRKTLNAILSESFVESSHKISTFWAERSYDGDFNGPSSGPESQRTLSMFRIRNETGVDIAYWLSGKGKGQQGNLRLLSSGSENGLEIQDQGGISWTTNEAPPVSFIVQPTESGKR